MKRTKLQITESNIRHFQKKLIENEKSQNTIKKYIRDIRKFQAYIKNEKLTKELVVSYKKSMEQGGHYQINSINSYLVSLNQFFLHMGWNDLCVKTIKVQRTAFEAIERELTISEYHHLVETAIQMKDETTALIFQTIASTGIRIGELGYICVESLFDGVVDIHNKGKVRRILLPSGLVPLLESYAKTENRRKGPVFCNRNGNPMDRKTIWRRMKKVAIYANVPSGKVFPHNLRHLFAKEFYRQSGDIMKLADILGHSNINTTRIYIRTAGNEHKKQLDAMCMLQNEWRNKLKDKEMEQHPLDKSLTKEEMPELQTIGDSIVIRNLSKISSNEITYEITIRKISECS